MSTIAIIPARSGSRGVPQKNKKLLLGKPLIQWTIEFALNAKEIDKVIVTSDDGEILNLAHELGAIIVDRPSTLATDDCQLDDVYLWTVRQAIADGDLNVDSTLVFLAPTSPFRNANDINQAVGIYKHHYQNFGTPVTIIAMYEDQRFHWRRNYSDNPEQFDSPAPSVIPVFQNPAKRLGRQWTREWLLTEAGSIYVVDTRQFLLNRHVRFEPHIAYIMPQERCTEIDTPLDFEIAEVLAPRLLGGK